MGKAFIEEKEKLEKVVEIINKKIEDSQNKFDSQQNFRIGFSEGKKGTQFIRQSLMSLYATDVYNLKLIKDNPYFGKIVFKENNKEQEEIYIGKRTVLGDNDDIIAYDWRSNIASMYYDYSIGKAKYTVDNKDINGDILNKRQINIKNGKLIGVDEHDTLTNDKILLKYLSESGDFRLKSIVSTIQKEQNEVIRNPIKNNYIIQGVAGSGKTTVALHRIAYLLYNESKNIEDKDFMILAPNKYFLNYISSLLPDLDIANVSQTTFEQIALDNIGKVKLESINKNLEHILNNDKNKDVIKFKSSLGYMNYIKNYFEFYINSHINKPIKFYGLELFSIEKIKSLLSFDEYKNLNYSKLIENTMKFMIKNIKENSEYLCEQLWKNYREEFLSLSKEHPRRQEIIDLTNEANNEIKKGCPKVIKEYFKFFNVSPINLYITFIENLNSIICEENINVKDIQEYTLNNLNKKRVGYEDLAPLLYIKYLLKDISNYKEFGHIVIDEGQDLSLSQYYVLKLLFNNSKFDIYGDINQSIYSYQCIKNWDELNTKILNNECKIINLNKGYRTTEQISIASNYILDKLNFNKSECVARKGEEVILENNSKFNNDYLLNLLKSYLNKGYNTIAIICKDDNETNSVYKELSKLGLKINKINEDNLSYNGGICVLPSYLSKGLEFDAVIIYDADERKYSSDSEIDMKLLYVSITRALHELYINYSENLTELLKPLSNEKTKKLVK